MEALNILVLHDCLMTHIGTVADHLNAFKTLSKHQVILADVRVFPKLNIPLERFDVVVSHYSVVLANPRFISEKMGHMLKEFSGLKVVFIQDEFRWVDATADALSKYGFKVLFSVVNNEVVDKIYHHDSLRHMRKEITLTGFVPEHLTRHPTPDYEKREIDVSYRARKLPYWMGSFGQEKYIIGERFAKDSKVYGLNCNIAHEESKRMYQDAWISLIKNSKAVLGTESGVSVCDFSGTLQPKLESYELLHPGIDFESFSRQFLKGLDGPITIAVISPRVFEAAALKTLMILYPGEYSGRLKAWRHYVPLEKDHSNMKEVVEVIRSPQRAKDIIENAYNEVALNPENTFSAMVKHFDGVIEEESIKLNYLRQFNNISLSHIENTTQWKQSQYKRVRTLILSSIEFVKKIIRLFPTSLQRPLTAFFRMIARGVFAN